MPWGSTPGRFFALGIKLGIAVRNMLGVGEFWRVGQEQYRENMDILENIEK